MRDNASVRENITTTTLGSGFYSYGGGVFLLGGTFAMKDNASISDNTALSNIPTYTTSSRSYGGGVYMAGGIFTVEDNASVSGNTASTSSHESQGGGVYVGGGSFALKDNASVRMNQAVSSGNTYGGGVYVANGSSFAIQDDASISGNAARGDVSFSVGGGVYVHTTGTLSKTGGVIYGSNEAGTDSDGNALKNTALTYNAHAVYYYASPVKIRGTTVGPDQNLSTGSNENWSD
jgi:hypothetical protein